MPSARCHLVALCLAFMQASAALAQTAAPDQSNAQHRNENGEMLRPDSDPVTWTFTYNSDVNADVSGGNGTGGAYLHRLGVIGDADLDRLVGWRAASAHISIHAIQGSGLSALRVGNALAVSGIEAEPALRLFNLWIEQKLGDHVSVRAGQFTAAQEFAVSTTASLFVNSTFGWPGSFANDLPSGGPAYPLSAPGVRLAAGADDKTMFRVAAFSGDPAGRGGGDPQRRDFYGLNGFRLQGRPFLIGEIQRSAGGHDPAWSLTIGGWVHLDRFDDLGYDTRGISLASPLSNGQPLRHAGNYAVYAMADGRLWDWGARSVHGFVRASASPADRNALDLYVDGGLSVTSLFTTRPNDVFGIGFAIARTSPRLRSLIRASAEIAGTPVYPPGFEGVIEASYQLQLKPGLYVQPNIQLVVHPSAAMLTDPGGFDRTPRNAVVIGIRTSFRL
ncbi:carbohydrate porin [Roseiarcaceae bacterium H3SJ34-1]|uniref:carbohydrate porin n=1 Tax=Terripilifer ovatus TaxID=3032367 RepID=UPI003AB975BE|nr:carbohydrate porin [Roseiarcaceae bacterium H3SJ34-1]